MVIADSKSVKNAGTACEEGYDAGKKISGIKLHPAVDTGGPPYAMKVTTADVTGWDGALGALRAYAPNLTRVVKVLCDGGEKLAGAVRKLMEVDVIKRNEQRKFAVLPKRRIVERSFAWLEKYRHLWKNCERKLRETTGADRQRLTHTCPRRTRSRDGV
jgi:transposase